jgi:hypothetical protein
VRGNSHARFLGEGDAVMRHPYPTKRVDVINGNLLWC